MKDKRPLGILIMCLSVLSFSILLVMTEMIFFIDNQQGSHFNNVIRYLPVFPTVLISITFIVGIILAISREKK